MSIAELAEATGFERRNIRFLISKDVVPEPRSRGRFASYGPEHVRALALYSDIKASGVHSLETIKDRMTANAVGPAIEIAPMEGVEVRIAPSVLERTGVDALVKSIGDAVAKAAANRKGEGHDA